MGNILDNLDITPTGLVRPSSGPLKFNYSVNPTEEARYDVSDRNVQYRMLLTVGLEFWANQAQKEDAIKIAEKVLLQHLHKDILTHIILLESAIYGDDREQALSIITDIRRDIGL